MCNICGRDDFINGHALGGHKKYCGKEEYKKNKKSRTFKRRKKKEKEESFDTKKNYNIKLKICIKKKSPDGFCCCKKCRKVWNKIGQLNQEQENYIKLEEEREILSELNNILKSMELPETIKLYQEIIDIINKL